MTFWQKFKLWFSGEYPTSWEDLEKLGIAIGAPGTGIHRNTEVGTRNIAETLQRQIFPKLQVGALIVAVLGCISGYLSFC